MPFMELRLPQDGAEPSLPDAVVAAIRHAGRFLLTRRAKTARNPGWWCLPGGAIEPGESQQAALRREMLEELGLDTTPDRLVWTALSADRHWTTYWWLVSTAHRKVRPAPREIDEVRWCTPDEVRHLEPLFPTDLQFFETVLPQVDIPQRFGPPAD
jgi:8-oxo-dGTP pyrophosphatase MutT (NUDIX family)